jgi:cubilin
VLIFFPFSGRGTPKPFNSTSEKMKVVFHSDDTINGDGFSAVWNQNCGGVLMADEQPRILSSPGYPKSYSSLLNCNYTIVASSPGKYININFLDFSVETTRSRCSYGNFIFDLLFL